MKGRPKIKTSPRADKAINLWKGATCNKVFRGMGISKPEIAAMRCVMRETDGDGGPWFEWYAKKNNLL